MRLLKLSEVKHLTGLGQSAIYARMAVGKFPRPAAKLSSKCVRWSDEQIDAWIAERIAETADSGNGKGKR